MSLIVEHLLEELWTDALDIILQIKDEYSRSIALSKRAQHLPEQLWDKALKILWTIKAKYYCSTALQAFLPKLEQLSIPFTDWAKVIDTLAYKKRGKLLDALPESKPTIIRLSNEQAFFDTLQAVREVFQQWP